MPVTEMLSALHKPESGQNYKYDLVKAMEKLAKALSEADIRALVDRLTQINVASMYVYLPTFLVLTL